MADIAPEFSAVVGPTSDSPPITVRQLLSMAGGMATDDAWADRHLDLTDDELDELISDGLTFAWAPQTHGEYSNLGFAMLGRVIDTGLGSARPGLHHREPPAAARDASHDVVAADRRRLGEAV